MLSRCQNPGSTLGERPLCVNYTRSCRLATPPANQVRPSGPWRPIAAAPPKALSLSSDCPASPTLPGGPQLRHGSPTAKKYPKTDAGHSATLRQPFAPRQSRSHAEGFRPRLLVPPPVSTYFGCADPPAIQPCGGHPSHPLPQPPAPPPEWPNCGSAHPQRSAQQHTQQRRPTWPTRQTILSATASVRDAVGTQHRPTCRPGHSPPIWSPACSEPAG